MNIKQAVKILEMHNKWRRDTKDKGYPMADPKELGKSIDLVVAYFGDK